MPNAVLYTVVASTGGAISSAAFVTLFVIVSSIVPANLRAQGFSLIGVYVFLIGDAEDKLPEMLRKVADCKDAGLSRLTVGSVAAEVARHSPVPVTVVKGPGPQPSRLPAEVIGSQEWWTRRAPLQVVSIAE